MSRGSSTVFSKVFTSVHFAVIFRGRKNKNTFLQYDSFICSRSINCFLWRKNPNYTKNVFISLAFALSTIHGSDFICDCFISCFTNRILNSCWCINPSPEYAMIGNYKHYMSNLDKTKLVYYDMHFKGKFYNQINENEKLPSMTNLIKHMKPNFKQSCLRLKSFGYLCY